MVKSVDDSPYLQRRCFHLAELTTYSALIFDAPIDGLLTISAKLSDDSRFAGRENVSVNLESHVRSASHS